MSTIEETTPAYDMVYNYLSEKKVPVSINRIHKETGLNKRQVLACCHQNEGITNVHPEFYGSGRFKGSVFVASTDKKYSNVVRFVDNN